MHTRTRIVLGSLLGAAAIHFAFLACGPRRDTGPGDGGLADVVLDALHDAADVVLDAETPDALAGDAGACTCTPAVAESSFALTVNRGTGAPNDIPRADYSTASMYGFPRLEPGTLQPWIQITAVATFLTAAAEQGTVTCTFAATPDGTPFQPAIQQHHAVTCTATLGATGDAAAISGTGTAEAYAVNPVLTDTSLEVRIDRVPITWGSGATMRTGSLDAIVFRTNNPIAHFVTPGRAYRP